MDPYRGTRLPTDPQGTTLLTNVWEIYIRPHSVGVRVAVGVTLFFTTPHPDPGGTHEKGLGLYETHPVEPNRYKENFP